MMLRKFENHYHECLVSYRRDLNLQIELVLRPAPRDPRCDLDAVNAGENVEKSVNIWTDPTVA